MVFFVGLKPDASLWAQERFFGRCLGIWTDGQTMWLCSTYQTWRLKNMTPEGQVRNNGGDSITLLGVNVGTLAEDDFLY